LGGVVLATVIILLPSLLGGALTGFLASRRVWWAESLADLLLLPADALLFIPAVLAGIVMVMLLGPSAGVGLAVAVVLLPRAVRVYQTLWTAAPEQRKIWVIGLAGSGGLLLGTLFAGLGLGTALEYLGFGVRSPYPTLGGMLTEATRYLTTRLEIVLAPGIAIWVCAFAFYTAADVLVGFFYSKEALARLNE
jgi:ABC-type antimicrobial peptide transport system permease subunit